MLPGVWSACYPCGMAVQTLKATWTPGLITTGAQLINMGDAIVEAVRRGLRNNAALTAARLRETTPRSTGAAQAIGADADGGDHVADGWRSREVGQVPGEGGAAGVDYAVEVFNANPRFDAPIKTKAGGTTSLGTILEFGSRPHTIRAKPGGVLAFYWPAIGDVVFTREVQHPGTRPYGFMAAATEEATVRAEALLAAAQRLIQQLPLGGP